MILRRASAQAPSSANIAPPTSHATPVSSDTAPATVNGSLSSSSDYNVDPPLSNRLKFVFAKQNHDYMVHSIGILQAQTETLDLLTQKLNSLNQIKESLEHNTEQEMNIRAAEVQCPLRSDLAWNPHVSPMLFRKELKMLPITF
ncbi:hypothetical protein F5879DRAFT_924225 [Lentinula edodes]|nr:hypothetical protein F5879DRAFT_924225 [Lentinula edodes]